MKLLEEYIKLFGGYPVKQFSAPLEKIEVVSSVSPEDELKIAHDCLINCELLQAEDCQSLSVMNEIVASGPVMQKKIRRNFIK